jgi:hypothetical protein
MLSRTTAKTMYLVDVRLGEKMYQTVKEDVRRFSLYKHTGYDTHRRNLRTLRSSVFFLPVNAGDDEGGA